MKLSLTKQDLTTLKKEKEGTYTYRLNSDVEVTGFNTEQEALEHASEYCIRILRSIIKKK